MGEARENDGQVEAERRRGRDRRRPNPLHAGRAVQVLLARLIAVFIGALIGFLAAYTLSASFTTPLENLASNAQENVRNYTQDLAESEPALNKARREYTQLAEQYERGLTDTAELRLPPEDLNPPSPHASPIDAESSVGAAAPVDAEAEPVPPPEPVPAPASGVDETHFAEVRERYQSLKDERQSLIGQIDLWQGELEDYRRSIDLLNLLGITVVVVFALLGYLLYPLILLLLIRLSAHLERLTAGLEERTAQATVGFFAGLVIAMVTLLAVFSTFSAEYSILSLGWFRLLFGAFVVVVLGLAGSLAGVAYFGPQREPDPYAELRQPAPPKLLDTSVIIDGRVHEISAIGFLTGMLVVPNSVLRELQIMADSADERKRTKGRRGLELVRKMQDDPRLNVRVFDDSSFDDQVKGTDEQLIVVAQSLTGTVVTNDFNLNRLAAIRGVRVMNVNALANAVKTNHLPGDEIDIHIIDRGKQRGQGVGYLDDGTMVVIEDGEPHIGKRKQIKLTSVSQTVQGRLLFGRVDLIEEAGGDGDR
jgi:uncharacterized protein YacL